MGKRAHARLPASSSERWIACTRSAILNMQADDKGSPYAAQGTDAHALCEHLLKQALRRKSRDPTPDLTWYDQEMQECAEGYRDFVMEQIEEAKALSPDPYIGIEQRLDYSRWVPEGFGTGDCVIIADGLLHIIDYKYGVGIPVAAENNSQLMCYAAAALDTFEGIYQIDRIKLSIYQPRRENVCTWETTKDELLKWADEVLAPAAQLALKGEGDFNPGDHCTFCKVKDTCRARAEEEMKLMKYEFEEPELLTDEEIALILPAIDNLTSWASDVKEYALNKALSGTRFKGFKVVEGKANRKYTDENAVATVLTEAGCDPFEKKVKGITALTKELGKKRFEELLSGLIARPKGKPVLVPESDKRPEYVNVTNSDFETEEGE